MIKNLVIVDIQYGFSGFYGREYLEKIKRLVLENKWETITAILNENEFKDEEEKLEYLPKWLVEKANTIIRKRVWNIPYEKYIHDLLENGFIETIPKRAWRKEKQLLLATPSPHNIFFVPEELQKISTELEDCLLIGGGEGYCLEDIKTTLEFHGVRVNTDQSLNYKLDNSKEQINNYDWTKAVKN